MEAVRLRLLSCARVSEFEGSQMKRREKEREREEAVSQVK